MEEECEGREREEKIWGEKGHLAAPAIVTSLLPDATAKEEDASDGRATPGVDQDM